jgi:hypothetical protein
VSIILEELLGGVGKVFKESTVRFNPLVSFCIGSSFLQEKTNPIRPNKKITLIFIE